MNSLFRVALKLLINDKGKFFTLIIGITFAVFLMMQMTSIFSGVMHRSAATIFNVNAKVWVMDPSVNVQTDNIPMPSYVLDVVRSIDGVKFAVPLYSGAGLVKLNDGTYQSANIIGLDDATLLGRPEMIAGNIFNIYDNDAFIVVKDAEYPKLKKPQMGATFEINDHRAVVVGFARALVSGLFGTPTLYTTFSRATTNLPTTRFTISYILVEPKRTQDIAHIKDQVRRSGYLALTRDDFIQKNKDYYLYKTGLGTNILIMTVISFVVGLSIAGQTFYAFVLENLNEFGALKAIGAKKNELIYMILCQATVVGFLGYGLGVFIAAVLIAAAKLRLPEYASLVTYTNLMASFMMVLFIITFSSYFAIRRIIKIDPFDVFRG